MPHLHEIIQVKGCITQERYIIGKTLPELERLLGFRKGRLGNGAIIAALTQLPAINQFELLGYSQVAEHRFGPGGTVGLDINKLKEMVLRDTFSLAGPKRLVRVIANTPHNKYLDNDTQYPPGLGVPQWKLIACVSARVINIHMPAEVHQ